MKKIVLCSVLFSAFMWANSPFSISWVVRENYQFMQGRVLFIKSLVNGVKLTNLKLLKDDGECEWRPMAWKTTLNKGESTSVHFFCKLKKVVIDSNKGQFAYDINIK